MRIGAVSYLNTRPLVYGLSQLAPQYEIIFDLPSRLADDLAAGRLDVALIPSVEYFGRPDYRIVSDACIACRGPVRSVQLFSRVPLPRIRSLALDEGSRTSAVLVQVLLKRLVGLAPRLVRFPIDVPPEAIEADALLMIGDRAMHPPAGMFAVQWDLGEIWCRWTGLPFVFAMWVARASDGSRSGGTGEREAALSDLGRRLSEARDRGVAHLEDLAAAEHQAAGLSRSECLTYFRDHLYFFLGPREREGLRRFREEASALGLLSTDPADQQAGRREDAVGEAPCLASPVGGVSEPIASEP